MLETQSGRLNSAVADVLGETIADYKKGVKWVAPSTVQDYLDQKVTRNVLFGVHQSEALHGKRISPDQETVLDIRKLSKKNLTAERRYGVVQKGLLHTKQDLSAEVLRVLGQDYFTISDLSDDPKKLNDQELTRKAVLERLKVMSAVSVKRFTSTAKGELIPYSALKLMRDGAHTAISAMDHCAGALVFLTEKEQQRVLRFGEIAEGLKASYPILVRLAGPRDVNDSVRMLYKMEVGQDAEAIGDFGKIIRFVWDLARGENPFYNWQFPLDMRSYEQDFLKLQVRNGKLSLVINDASIEKLPQKYFLVDKESETGCPAMLSKAAIDKALGRDVDAQSPNYVHNLVGNYIAAIAQLEQI